MIDHIKKKHVSLSALFALLILATVLLFSRPPISQPLEYHNFADQRSFFRIPNCFNVLSNLPFVVIGVWGLLFLARPEHHEVFVSRDARAAYAAFFLGVFLTFFGSCYYHLHPTNRRMVFDRLPMTLAFMGLLSAVLADRISPKLGKVLLLPLITAGCFSVGYWYLTETLGHGDLRPYLLVQFGSLLVITATLALFPSRYRDTWCIVVALALYACAKLFENLDGQVFKHLYIASGHTLKHLAAGAGTYFILLMLQRRGSRLPKNAAQPFECKMPAVR